MAKPQPNAPIAHAEHTHYALVSDDSVYQAMKSPPGYEDANPSDWRPATAAEIKQYKADAAKITSAQTYHPDGSTKTSGTGAIGNTGGVLRLADEDEVAAAPVPPLPAVPPQTGAPIAVTLPPAAPTSALGKKTT